MNAKPANLFGCLLAALMLVPAVVADPRDQSTCVDGGNPCVIVTLESKVSDLWEAQTGLGADLAVVTTSRGDLVLSADGDQLFRGTFVLASGNGIPDPAVLDQTVGPVSLVFEDGEPQRLTAAPTPTAGLGAPVAELWLAHVEVRVNANIHYVVLAAIVVEPEA